MIYQKRLIAYVLIKEPVKLTIKEEDEAARTLKKNIKL